MPLIVVGQGTPVIPPGTYPATLVGIAPKRLATKFSNPPGQEEDFLEWTWMVEGADKDAEITSLTSLATTPKSRIFEYLLALVGVNAAQVGAGFDENDLVGKPVMVQIVEQEGFSRIDKIIAAPAKARERKPAPAPEPVTVPADDKDDELPF